MLVNPDIVPGAASARVEDNSGWFLTEPQSELRRRDQRDVVTGREFGTRREQLREMQGPIMRKVRVLPDVVAVGTLRKNGVLDPTRHVRHVHGRVPF